MRDFVTRDVGHGNAPLVGSECAECHMWLEPGEVFHPWLYCLLWKNGVDDPEAYLRELGFTRQATLVKARKG